MQPIFEQSSKCKSSEIQNKSRLFLFPRCSLSSSEAQSANRAKYKINLVYFYCWDAACFSTERGENFLKSLTKFSWRPNNFPFKGLERTFKGLERTFKGLKHTFKGLERKILPIRETFSQDSRLFFLVFLLKFCLEDPGPLPRFYLISEVFSTHFR